MEVTNKARLLIIEDDEDLRTQMNWALSQDYDVSLAEDRSSALEIFKKKRPAVVTLDLGLPPRPEDAEEGFLALAEILEHDSLTKVIIITGRDEKEHALEAIGQGAYDFLTKPIQLDELQVILRRALYVSRLEREHRDLQERLSSESFEAMLGTSPQMQEVFDQIRKVATTDAPVLIVGETGTGKELAALAVHRRSSRKEGPFVIINCGAIPENLLESELFGHEKGAFTGAHVQRKGKVEFANGGTLFFDEIGELPPLLQVKLLRFLQDWTIQRIGGRESIEVDARIIAATQKNLKEALHAGEFREDLYYRLSVVTIDMLPLRSRDGDILLLANYFRRKSSEQMKRPRAKFDPSAIQALREHEWPGNVRELENRVKRAVVMGDGPFIRAEDLDLHCANQGNMKKQTLKDVRERLERDFICKALATNDWNVARTAEQIGVTRPTLYDLIKKYDLRKQ